MVSFAKAMATGVAFAKATATKEKTNESRSVENQQIRILKVAFAKASATEEKPVFESNPL